MPPRTQTSLDGTWSFAPDPTGVGLAARWFERPGFERQVPVPSPWQLYGEDLVGYTGLAWYHRSFEAADPGPGRELVLRFDAVDYEARVWVNGVEVGRHEGGYTPFECVLDPALLRETNHLVLRAYDPADNSEIPHGKQGSWYTRVSGPWQPVSLLTRDAIHLTGLHVTPFPEPRLRVTAHGGNGAALDVTVHDPDGREVFHTVGEMVHGEATLGLSLPTPRLWSPEDPALYTVTVTLLGDSQTATFGLRWVAYRDGLVYLNGEARYLRGALDQAFYPETVYRAPSLEAIEAEIRLAKAMGLNLLRKHIKLEDPRYLDACDRLGMLVWEEPACFYKYTPLAKERFTREIEAMIARDYNHPSIIAWSLYNEEWGLEWRLWRDSEKQAHVEALFDHAKRLDPTRLICDNSGWAHVKTDLNDCHRYFPAPDLISECEADLARYVETPEINFVAGKQANAAGVPVVVSEFGVWGLPEPGRITEALGGKPWWFAASWAGHVEEFKYPETAYRHFPRYGLDAVFKDLDELCRHGQGRMMRALKPIIEAMRARADLAGYVVTEFTDIEWEGNGWLDYFRRPKADHERFAWFNAETIVMARLEAHSGRAGERLAGRVLVSHHGGNAFEGTVRWHVPGYPALVGEAPIQVAARTNSRPQADALAFAIPAVPRATAATLVLELLHEGRVVATNQEELTFHPLAPATPAVGAPVYLVGEARRLAGSLADLGLRLAPALTPDVLVVTDRFDLTLQAHVEAGGAALFLAEAGDQAPAKGDLSFRRLPRGESWDRAASLLYLRPGVLGDLPVGVVPGWELEGLYPHAVLALGNYMHDFGGRAIELTSNQAGLAPEHILGGYFEGWLGKFAATLATVPYGRGQLLVTTWRLLEGAGQRPMADAMLARLLELAARPVDNSLAPALDPA